MTTDDYNLLKKGFLNKRIYEQEVVRKAVATVISPWLKNAPKLHEVWPLPGDKERIERENLESRRKSLETLNRLAEGVTYVMKDGKIVSI